MAHLAERMHVLTRALANGMFMHKFLAVLVGIIAAVAGVVTIARSSADTNVISFPKAQPFTATCPKFDWPYGCKWRPEAVSRKKHFSLRKSKRDRLL
jgi:hypothetical protein